MRLSGVAGLMVATWKKNAAGGCLDRGKYVQGGRPAVGGLMVATWKKRAAGGCLVVNTWKENVKCEMAVGEK